MEIDELVEFGENLKDFWLHPGYKVRKATAMAYSKYVYAGFTTIPFCFSLGSAPMICNIRSEQIDPPPHVTSIAYGTFMLNTPFVTLASSSTATRNSTKNSGPRYPV